MGSEPKVAVITGASRGNGAAHSHWPADEVCHIRTLAADNPPMAKGVVATHRASRAAF
jgi:hypothetical protein